MLWINAMLPQKKIKWRYFSSLLKERSKSEFIQGKMFKRRERIVADMFQQVPRCLNLFPNENLFVKWN